MFLRMLVTVVFLFVIDIYVFSGLKVLLRNSTLISERTGTIIFWSLCGLCYALILAAAIYDYHEWNKTFRTYSFAFVVIFYFSKLFFVVFLLIDDIIRGVRYIISMFDKSDAKELTPASGGEKISRQSFIVKTGLLVAAIPFGAMIYGMVKGAYNYSVRKITLKHDGIPKAFDGFRIVQISDLHTGSFTFEHKVDRAVDIILAQKPDIIFFTGDLVNEKSIEAEPFIELFGRIKAPHGVFSILGNHDYGDYHRWDSPEAKIANLDRLKAIHAEMGWNLMLDTNHHVEKGGEKIGLVGVQNWSSHMQFPKYGDLGKATNNFVPQGFNILLSHDPSHWTSEVLTKFPFIHLMLAGHTHGMQFGIEIPGFKWSPVQYIYKEWAGLYTAAKQHLYVNRGLGFLGYPGRVGIMPEITVIDLKYSS
nr:metallophosphoesterase [Bacteroidota bacterium]